MAVPSASIYPLFNVPFGNRVPDLFFFDRCESVAGIASVHGTSDEVIPIWPGKALFDETVSPKYAYWVEGAGHNNVMLRGGANYDTTLRAFFRFLAK